MAFGDVLLGVLDHGGSAVLASVLTAAYLQAQGARGQVTTHERQARDLNEDLRRWVRDRDRQLQEELDGIGVRARHGELDPEYRQSLSPDLRDLPPGASAHQTYQLRRGAEAKQRALHEYRDEATRKLREADALEEAEGRVHRWVRTRRRLPPKPRLLLPQDCTAILAWWRAAGNKSSSTDDPTEFEPRLRALETAPST